MGFDVSGVAFLQAGIARGLDSPYLWLPAPTHYFGFDRADHTRLGDRADLLATRDVQGRRSLPPAPTTDYVVCLGPGS